MIDIEVARERLKEAKAILEKYIQSTPNAVDRMDAQALLNELRDV